MVLPSGHTILKALRAHWPCNREPLLLGSLLTVRRELELLAARSHASEIHLHFTGVEGPLPDTVRSVFAGASISFFIHESAFSGSYDWPGSHASFLSTVRLSAMDADPVLDWNSHVLERAREHVAALRASGKVVLMHVRTRVDAEGMGASNVGAWWEFIESLTTRGHAVVLLGDDPYDTPPPRGAVLARERGMRLDEQLAAISIADAFMGAASGISNAAMLSATPYAILKHPDHHREAMEAELGQSDAFPFAYPRQVLIRAEDSLDALNAAWKILWE
jgi:hypothetical protein